MKIKSETKIDGSAEWCSRIRIVRQMLRMSQKDFAASVGLSQGHLSVLEKKSETSNTTLILAVCHRHKVSEDWLRTGKGEPFPQEASPAGIPIYNRLPEHFTQVPEAGDRVGRLSLEGLPEKGFAVYQRGEYMAPTILAQDLVICDNYIAEIQHDDLILVQNKYKTFIIRRYRSVGGKIILSADNPAYTPFEMDKNVRVVAKVVKVLRSVNT